MARPAEGRARSPRPAFSGRVAALALIAALPSGAGAATVQLRSAPLAGLRTEVAAIIMQGVAGGSIPLAVATRVEDATAQGDDRWLLPLAVEVPGAALLAAAQRTEPDAGAPAAANANADADAGESELRIELYVYALDPEQRVVAHRAERLTLALAASGERLFEAGLRFQDAISLPAGTFSLRFLVFLPQSFSYGVALQSVELAPAAGSARLGAPRFGDTCDSWLEARSRTAIAGSAVAPTRAVLRAGRPASATVALLGAGGERREGWEVAAVFAPLTAVDAAAGREIAATEVRAGAAATELAFTLTPPADLPQGRYLLRSSARHSTVVGGELSSPATEVWVLAPDAPLAGDCAPAWGEVYRRALGGALGPVLPPAVAGSAPPVDGGAERRLKNRYLDVLSELSSGRPMRAAGAALGTAEAEFVSDLPDTFARLRAVETAAALDLVTRDRRCLPLLLALHEEAYERHFAAARYGLATHSRELVLSLSDEVMTASTDEAERRLVARVLTSLADRTERHKVVAAAQELFERALELDPDNLEARLLLATSYERVARTAPARRHLELLVATSAGHVEGRLRLGVLLARDGRWDDAERLLRRLLGQGLGGWQRAMAYETLARMLFDRERFDEAVELLTEARASMPDQQRLALLGAYALDRAGRPAEAALWIAELPQAAPEGSARLRYGELPPPGGGELTTLRDLVARNLGVRLPILARALDELGQGGP